MRTGKKAYDKYRGNDIIFRHGKWVYKENGLSVAKTIMPCGKCGQEKTKEGHDACIGVLPGVMNACCGHGEEREAYVQFLNGKCVRGKTAIRVMNILKRG